jgi:hypothetical protein
VAGIVGGDQTSEFACGVNEAIGDVDSVRFSAANRAWLMAGGSQIYRTVAGATDADVGSAAAGWEFPNQVGMTGTCKVPRDIDDAFPIAGVGRHLLHRAQLRQRLVQLRRARVVGDPEACGRRQRL